MAKLKRLAVLGLALVAGLSLAPAALWAAANYTAVDEFSKPRFSINSQSILQDQRLPAGQVNFSDQKLLRVLVNTRTYFARFAAEDPVVQRDGVLSGTGVTTPQVLRTLDFMIQTLQEDIQQKRPARLRDPNFINQNFRVINWRPFNPRNPQQTQQLRITKYAVFIHPGAKQRTATYNVPLYALPAGAEADKFYLKYTKQQVLSGIYESGGREAGRVKPIAYLTREGFEEALLQGTILIRFNDGTSAFFNVDRNNGIAYVKGLAGPAQGRYWYFQQVEAIKGYGNKIQNKISIEPGVTFAGDVFNVGLGRIIVLESGSGTQRRLSLGVIADTGGAFVPSLYQLDYLAGTFNNRQEFQRYISTLPEFAKAYILVRK
jgi:hypothetical protein